MRYADLYHLFSKFDSLYKQVIIMQVAANVMHNTGPGYE